MFLWCPSQLRPIFDALKVILMSFVSEWVRGDGAK